MPGLESALGRTGLCSSPSQSALFHFKTELISDLVSLGCKKTGHMSQGCEFLLCPFIGSVL